MHLIFHLSHELIKRSRTEQRDLLSVANIITQHHSKNAQVVKN